MMRNLPNYLTISRLVALPFLLILMFIDREWAAWLAVALYTISAVTDWLDGYAARRMNFVSAFGKFLDPIADKIFVMAVIMCLIATGKLDGWWIIAPLLIMSREFLISGLREFLGPLNITVPVSKLAKWKTASQMTALGFLIAGDYGDRLMPFDLTMETGYLLITAATVLTIITGWDYLKTGFKHL